MKKWILLAGLMVLVILVVVPVAFAQVPAGNPGNTGMGYGSGYVDQNGDGVCDNFVDEDGDGVCDHAGTGTGGQGSGFVDQDGDGVCDHAGVGGQQQGRHGGARGRGVR